MSTVWIASRAAQVLLFIGAVILSAWVALPWPGVILLVLLCGQVTAGRQLKPLLKGRFERPLAAFPWLCSAGILASAPAARHFTVDGYYGLLAWLVAGGILLAAFRQTDDTLGNRFKVLGLGWGLLGSLAWIAGAYTQNLPGSFYLGLASLLVLLVAVRVVLQLRAVAVQGIHCLALLLIGLPVADWFYRPSAGLETRQDPPQKYYSYAEASRDPAAFSRWWRYYLDQWDEMGKDVFTGDPDKALPVRLKPGGRGYLFQSPISINSLGFRGPEVAPTKGEAYRIVALGESTTFGCTLEREDRPWPEVLEQLINEQLGGGRRVEVVNAGVPACNVRHSVHRLLKDVLPLQPDMIISYHGANGFRMLNNALPSLLGVSPAYRERPLKLLADCEYRLKVMGHRRRQTPGRHARQPSLAEVLNSGYAEAYRDLIRIAQTNGVRVVLANFSMAVNGRSERGPVDFYGSMFPGVRWYISANEAHSQLVAELSQQAQCVFVDTQPGLDGEHEKFIDLVHMTQPGRRRLAENIFSGIRETVEADLRSSKIFSKTSPPDPCHPFTRRALGSDFRCP